MPIDTAELSVFVSVVKYGGFARAARAGNLTPSGVSRIITRLERRLGARLLQRSTRKQSLTEAGAAFYARAVRILRDLAEAEDEVSQTGLTPTGVLRISMPTVFGRLHVVPRLTRLMSLFPQLSLDVNMTDRFVDLIEEGVDLAIRIGSLSDSRLVARRLCTNRRLLVASPAYVERRGTPVSIEDLAEHDCLMFSRLNRPAEWRLVGPDGLVTVAVAGPLSTDNGEVASEAAKQGFGIALGASFSVGAALSSGELIRILPDYEFERTAIFAVYPSARQLSRKVRVVADALTSFFADPPSWDVSLAESVPGFRVARPARPAR